MSNHSHTSERSLRTRPGWIVGHLCLFSGLYLLLFVGGIYAQVSYGRIAARGDSTLPLVDISPVPPIVVPPPAAPAAPRAVPVLHIPLLNTPDTTPTAAPAVFRSTVERVVIPAANVDSKVIEIGWALEQQPDGESVSVWQVAKYAVGHHHGSANPGEGSNIVLSGHVGGYGRVFRALFDVVPGDQVTLYSNGQQYLYVVQERLVLDEETVSPEQQAANARYIAPTDQEVVTLVTCWPPEGEHKFEQRVVVRAVPYGPQSATRPTQQRGVWSVR